MKKLSMIIIIAFSMISTTIHALEFSIEKQNFHINESVHLDHSHMHHHFHDNLSHSHSHSHGDSHSHSNTAYYYENRGDYLYTLQSISVTFRYQVANFPNPFLQGIFRPPRS